jgi:hypothetical protein
MSGLLDNATVLEPPRSAFRLLTIDEIWATLPSKALVEGLIPESVLAQLYGLQGSYKSFAAVALGLSLATGMEFLGHRVLRSGVVVYVAAEDPPGVAARVRAWGTYHHDEDGTPLKPEGFRMLGEALPLLMPDKVDRFLQAVTDETGVAPLAVILDTTSRCIAGMNENAPEVGSALVATLERIKKGFADALIVPVHHTGWNGEHSRGTSTFPFACDVQLLMEKPNGDRVGAIKIEKQRNGESGTHLDVRLSLVPEHKSAVLVPLPADEAETAVARPTRTHKWAGGQRRALRALLTLGKPASYTDWQRQSGDAPTTFDDARRVLLSLGCVGQTERGDWVVTDDGRGQATMPQWQV